MHKIKLQTFFKTQIKHQCVSKICRKRYRKNYNQNKDPFLSSPCIFHTNLRHSFSFNQCHCHFHFLKLWPNSNSFYALKQTVAVKLHNHHFLFFFFCLSHFLQKQNRNQTQNCCATEATLHIVLVVWRRGKMRSKIKTRTFFFFLFEVIEKER